jgi:hypothetical protein
MTARVISASHSGHDAVETGAVRKVLVAVSPAA